MAQRTTPWSKVPAALYDDPRICGLSRARPHGRVFGLAALAAAYMWAGRNESDGFIPDGTLAPFADDALLASLVELGFLERVDGGFMIAGFLEINATHERREAARADQRRRTAESRARSRGHAVGNTVTPGVTPPPSSCSSEPQEEEERRRNCIGNGVTPRATPADPELERAVAGFSTAFQGFAGAAPTDLEFVRAELRPLVALHGAEIVEGRAIAYYAHQRPARDFDGGMVPDARRFVWSFDRIPIPRAVRAQRHREEIAARAAADPEPRVVVRIADLDPRLRSSAVATSAPGTFEDEADFPELLAHRSRAPLSRG